MKNTRSYKIIIGILAAIIIVQAMVILGRAKKPPKPKPPVAVKGRIAIVIDDWGYNLNNLHILDNIKSPLTCAVLPNLPYSSTIAGEADAKGFQVILHLPMEPHEKYRLEENTILTGMGEERIKDILSEDLSSVGSAKGVSNHMGSRATEDVRTMEVVFRELKKRRLYFLDSFVTNKSICSGLARRAGLGFAKRDIFLDNKNDPEYITQQLYKLKAKAKAYGQAIGIGHDRRVTLEVLGRLMPQLEREGYKFVFVSDILE